MERLSVPHRRGLPVGIEKMPDGKNRMPPEDARAGVAHQGFDLFAPLRLIAMNRAFDAGRLVLLKRTFLQPRRRVIQQLATFRAQFNGGTMHPAAVADDHRRHGLAFPFQPFPRQGCFVPGFHNLVPAPTAPVCGMARLKTTFSPSAPR